MNNNQKERTRRNLLNGLFLNACHDLKSYDIMKRFFVLDQSVEQIANGLSMSEDHVQTVKNEEIEYLKDVLINSHEELRKLNVKLADKVKKLDGIMDAYLNLKREVRQLEYLLKQSEEQVPSFPMDRYPIEKLSLPNRVFNVLISNEVRQVKDLEPWDKQELLKLKGFGEASLHKLQKALAMIGCEHYLE